MESEYSYNVLNVNIRPYNLSNIIQCHIILLYIIIFIYKYFIKQLANMSVICVEFNRKI